MSRLRDLTKAAMLQFAGRMGEDITFESADSPPVEVTVKGRVTKHWMRFNEWMNGGGQGAMVNAKVASCSVCESLLTDEDYPVRGGDGEVNLKGHYVSWKDSTGVLKEYGVNECFPDEELGYIVIICSSVES